MARNKITGERFSTVGETLSGRGSCFVWRNSEARRMTRRWAATMGWAGIKTLIATPGTGAPRMACGLPKGFCTLNEEKESGDTGSMAEKVDGGKTMIQVKFGEGSRLDKLLARERPSIPFSVIQKIIRNKKVCSDPSTPTHNLRSSTLKTGGPKR